MQLMRRGAVQAFFTMFFGLAASASAQTHALMIHMNVAGATGDVRVFSGAGGPAAACNPTGNNPCDSARQSGRKHRDCSGLSWPSFVRYRPRYLLRAKHLPFHDDGGRRRDGDVHGG